MFSGELGFGPHWPPYGDGLGLPLYDDGLQLLVVEGMTGSSVGELSNEHAAYRCHALETGCRIHHVSGNGSLARGRRVPHRYHRLAGVHRLSHCELQTRVGSVQLVNGLDDAQGGSDSPLGVIAVCDRHTEHGDHSIADELLDLPTEVLDLAANAGVIWTEGGPDILRISAIRTIGEPDEIAEEDGDEPPLFRKRLSDERHAA